MAFEKILGQEKYTYALKEAVERGNLAHAYLFEGPMGIGKKAVAYELVKIINCTGAGEKPCHRCNSCIKLDHGNHPEVHWIEEEGSIRIERIRDLQRDIQMRPYEGTYKVYIISQVDRMTLQAQNALLKTLEEPPSHAVMILLTENANRLLPTILSRCQRLKFQPLGLREIEEYLLREKDLGLEEAKVVASFSNGIIGRALRIVEDTEFRQRREQVLEILMALPEEKTPALLARADFFVEQREYMGEVLDFVLSWYRDLLIYKETENRDFLINADHLEELINQGKRIDLDKIRDIIFIVEKTKENLKSNVNFQLNIEAMLLSIQEVLLKW